MSLTQWWEIVGWVVYAAAFALPGWLLGYRQGYVVGVTDGRAKARKLEEQR